MKENIWKGRYAKRIINFMFGVIMVLMLIPTMAVRAENPAGRGGTWDILYSEVRANGNGKAYPVGTRIYMDIYPGEDGDSSAYFMDSYDAAVSYGYINGEYDSKLGDHYTRVKGEKGEINTLLKEYSCNSNSCVNKWSDPDPHPPIKSGGYWIFNCDNGAGDEFYCITSSGEGGSLEIDPDDIVGGSGEDTYTIIYNTNGGEEIDSVADATALPSPLLTPTREGYEFAGWYTDTKYQTEAVAGTSLTGNVTLYAKWEIKSVGVTIDYSMIPDITIGEKVPDFSAFEEGKYEGALEIDNANVYVSMQGWWMKNSKGIWEAAPHTEFANDITYGYKFKLAPKAGYTFGKNNSILHESTGKNEKIELLNDVQDNDISFCFTLGTLEEIEEEKNPVTKYTITYNTNGGNEINSIKDVALPSILPTPTKAGYEFAGWYIDEEFKTEAEAGTPLTGDVTLYAKWKANQVIPPYVPSTPSEPEKEDFIKDTELAPDAPIDGVSLDNEKSELLNAPAIFTEAERQAIENGSGARVWIEVTYTDESKISAENMAKVETVVKEAAGEDSKLIYFNADFFKQVSGGTKTQIFEPGIMINVTIKIPEELINKDESKQRQYKMIRLHEDKATGETIVEVIEGTFNAETNEFTYQTDKFSVYAIAYKDVPVESGKPDDSDKPADPDKPVDPTPGTVDQKFQNSLGMNAKLKVSQTQNQINIEWGKVSGADGYNVYATYCGQSYTKKSISQVKRGSITKITLKKIEGQKLNLKKNYKLYVEAYKNVNGKKMVLGKTITAYIVGRENTAYTNAKNIKLEKNALTLKKGKTATIKAKTILVDKSKKQLSDAHAKEFRYETSNKKVAKVNANGKVEAVRKGTCYIYVYARNGFAKRVKITVK